MAIGGVLAGGIVSAIFQIYQSTDRNSDTIVANIELENAGRWLSRDGQMAFDTDLIDDGGNPVISMKLWWTDWTDWGNGTYAKPEDFVSHSVSYAYIADDNELTRLYCPDYVINSETCNAPVELFIVARNIQEIEFSLLDGVITAKVIAFGKDPGSPQEERSYNISLRPIDKDPRYYYQ